MKKHDKEVQQAFLDEEKRVLAKLEDSYEEALIEINNKIEMLMARNDADLQHVIYQIEYQRALKTQVQAVLENLQANEFETVSEYLTNSYTNGYIGAMYSMHKQGVPLIIPIDQSQVVEAIKHDTKLSTSLYTALGHDIKDLQKKISSEISRGIATGQGYGEIARNIAAYSKVPLNNAMRIARTESHRIQCKSAMDAQYKAKAKGADVVKQWDAALDGNTRPHHRMLDGQIRELDEPFEVGGMKAMFPGDFGDPAEDCNCRCALLQIPRWALDDEELENLKERAEYFGLDKTKDFEEYKEKYLKAADSDTVRSSVQKTQNKGTELQELEKQFRDMTEGYSYDDFINDFGSIEDGFEGSSDAEILKAKEISERIKLLRSESGVGNKSHTRQESIKILNNHGIKFNDISKDSISEEVLSKYADFVENFEVTHPGYFNNNKLNLQSVSIMDEVKLANHRVDGKYSNDNLGTNGIEIKISSIGKVSDYLAKSDDYDVRSFAHEYGHYVADTMLYNKLDVGYSDVVQNAINRYYEGDIFKGPKDLKDCLSPYGSTSYQEAFAEAFAEAYTSEEPREFARIFKEELENALASRK